MSEDLSTAATDSGKDDTTLGGYFHVHNRPPAYEGSDGHPYTVSLEVEKTGNLLLAFLWLPSCYIKSFSRHDKIM